MTGTADRIKRLRTAAGLTPANVAARLGIGVSAYEDLEAYDDELSSVRSIEELLALARILRTPPRDLVDPEHPAWPDEYVSFEELAERLRSKAEIEGMPELECRVGWDLSDFLSSDKPALGQYPLQFLRDAGVVLDIPWRSLVPVAA